MNKNYYSEYYEMENTHWWFKVRNAIIIDSIKKNIQNSKIKILNVGVGTGRSTELLSQIGEVTSVEFDKDCCEFVREKLGIEVIEGSILNLDFPDNSFDLVCAFDVIEHVEDDQLAINELKRVCKNKGKICITVPAFMFLWSNHDEVNQHFRRYIGKELKELFQNKKQIVYFTYFNSFLFIPISIIRIISKIIPIKRGSTGSDFNVVKSSFLNSIFLKIFSVERNLLNTGAKFPFGISMILIYENLKK